MEATKAQTIYRMAASSGLAALYPGYFALVMATGIVSIAAHFQGKERIAHGLLALNLVAYVALWGLTAARFVCFRGQFINDLTHHCRGAAFLTKAAATCVLGSQLALLTPWMRLAEGLWFFGAGLAVVLGYTFIAAVTLSQPKPSLEQGINGAWLLVVVALESLSVLGTLLAPSTTLTGPILFISLLACLVGAMLYVCLTAIILYRWMFFSVKPEQLTPDYWINMGALAITALAAALLTMTNSFSSLLPGLDSFLTGSMLLTWATATWWIPLLLIIELWRHLPGRVPLQYGPEYWALVFPLGMYAVATFMLARVTGMTFLNDIATFFTYAALLTWAIVFFGMLRALARCLPLRLWPPANWRRA